MKLTLISCAIALFLCGCVDRGRCLSSHYEQSGYWNTQYTTMCNGSTCTQQFAGMYWVDTSGDVCDQWEFPDGKK